MKIRKIIISLVALAILMLAPAHLSAFSVSRLDNGITLIVERDTSAKLVGVDVWVKAGSGDETSQNNGVSHFIEHLVFNGTTTRKAGDIDIEIESLGATLNARASRDWAHFFTTVSSRYFSKALELIGDALINPTFEAEQVESEKRVILDEITRKQVDYKSFIKDLLALELYSDHPYALPIEGTIGSVLNIKKRRYSRIS